MNKFEALCNLRSFLRAMEQDLGLDELTTAEKDVFLAAQNIGKNSETVITSRELRSHPLVSLFPPATFHRALKALVERGYLRKAEGSKTKSYRLVD